MCSNYQVITLLSLPRNASARVLKRSLKLGSIGGFKGDRTSRLHVFVGLEKANDLWGYTAEVWDTGPLM